jgi:Leucine-rich repeat (LRR) protein
LWLALFVLLEQTCENFILFIIFRKITANLKKFLRYFCTLRDIVSTEPDDYLVLGEYTHDVGRSNEDVKQLLIEHEKMIHFPDVTRIFATFTNLYEIFVNDIQLTYVSRQNFIGFNNLITIEMKDNRIEELPADLLNDCTDLFSLNFSKNKISSLNENLLEFNSELRLLYLSFNLIETIPRNFFAGTPSISRIFMTNNRLTIIEVNFLALIEVKQIDFSQNVCINDYHENTEIGANLQEFQSLIEISCSAIPP